MRVLVAGLWHLGTVTAACCGSAGHDVLAYDDDFDVIDGLQHGRLPVQEPGLSEMIARGVQAGKLRFTNELGEIGDTDVLWICYDTPVDESDLADTGFVTSRVKRLLSVLKRGAVILISSQLPVGSTAALEGSHPEFSFAYSPENLRLGKAIEVFTKPDRVVIGVRNGDAREVLSSLFAPFTENLEWMSVESAEMTKHAINAFLGTSVAFINEIAVICERTGADAQEVERGLKTDARIGNRAYLHPGAAFAGGTLARDLSFLVAMGRDFSVRTRLFQGVMDSNADHLLWTQRRLSEVLGSPRGKAVAILGLTYKPGTNTLRRSSAVETCRWLLNEGADVRAFDPAISELPEELREIHLKSEAGLAMVDADAVLIATPWPEFRSLSQETFVGNRKRMVVIDPARYLEDVFKGWHGVEYHGIGISR